MINAALPLYVWARRADGGEPRTISILAVLLQESALSLCRCSAAFQITEKTHQTLHFGFTPSRAVCCFLMKPVYAFMESVLVSVCVASSTISCVLSKLSVNRHWFYSDCLFCFCGPGKGRLVLTWLVNLTWKLIMCLNPFCYVRLPKAFQGIIWGNGSRVGARCSHSTLKSHWAAGATLHTSQSCNLKHQRRKRNTLRKKGSLSCLILSCDPDQIEAKKTPKKLLYLKFNLLYDSLIIFIFLSKVI